MQDDWADYEIGDVITVNAGPGANQINFQGYPSPAYGNNTANTIVDVDPATGAATISKQSTGDYGGPSAEVEGSGFVFSCTGVINLNMTVYYGGTPYAGIKLILQKR